jgi:hypothetical protein
MVHKEISEKPGFLKRIFRFGNTYIDYKMGMIGALVMGFIVFWINYHGTHDLLGSFTASLKQGTYTLFFGGIIMRSSELLSIRIGKKTIALIAAVIIPSAISLILTFGIHSLKGTPKPLASTLPTAIFVIPSTLAWGIINRRKHDKTISAAEPPDLS